ncbi:MAG: hypothetical protein ABL929_11200 [Ferruginibacter sp.]|nr:hypothetical protein [Ferruginibacter sp.]
MKNILKKITNWEAWPFKIIYAPLVPFWVWNMIRSGSVWFFTPSNPKLTFGGMEGEPKREMYDLLPQHLYPKTFNILPTQSFEELKVKLQKSEITYPLVVKPEVGGQGILFRKIDDETALKHYHTLMEFEYIVQEMVLYKMEVSVFHIRHPKEQKGIITGFLHKIPLHVIGNGILTLNELILAHPKANLFAADMLVKHANNLKNIITQNEKYILSYAANHNRGAHFVDLKNEIDDKLVAIFDKLSIEINDFFYGRYDILCNSVEDLKVGKNFSILEYNGCGAEPNHFYDTGYSLLGAYKEILKHWKALYEISKYNKQKGVKPWGFVRGFKFRKYTRDLYAAMKIIDNKIG